MVETPVTVKLGAGGGLLVGVHYYFVSRVDFELAFTQSEDAYRFQLRVHFLQLCGGGQTADDLEDLEQQAPGRRCYRRRLFDREKHYSRVSHGHVILNVPVSNDSGLDPVYLLISVEPCYAASDLSLDLPNWITSLLFELGTLHIAFRWLRVAQYLEDEGNLATELSILTVFLNEQITSSQAIMTDEPHGASLSVDEDFGLLHPLLSKVSNTYVTLIQRTGSPCTYSPSIAVGSTFAQFSAL